MEPNTIKILMKEYFELQSIYESYNAQSLTIKEWSVSIWIAALLAAYSEPISRTGGRAGVALAALVPLPFYLTDALWKSFQMAYLPRLQSIERAFYLAAKDGDILPLQDLVPLQGIKSWAMAYKVKPIEATAGKADLFLSALTSMAVLLPYAILFVLGLLVALVFPPRVAAKAARD